MPDGALQLAQNRITELSKDVGALALQNHTLALSLHESDRKLKESESVLAAQKDKLAKARHYYDLEKKRADECQAALDKHLADAKQREEGLAKRERDILAFDAAKTIAAAQVRKNEAGLKELASFKEEKASVAAQTKANQDLEADLAREDARVTRLLQDVEQRERALDRNEKRLAAAIGAVEGAAAELVKQRPSVFDGNHNSSNTDGSHDSVDNDGCESVDNGDTNNIDDDLINNGRENNDVDTNGDVVENRSNSGGENNDVVDNGDDNNADDNNANNRSGNNSVVYFRKRRRGSRSEPKMPEREVGYLLATTSSVVGKRKRTTPSRLVEQVTSRDMFTAIDDPDIKHPDLFVSKSAKMQKTTTSRRRNYCLDDDDEEEEDDDDDEEKDVEQDEIVANTIDLTSED